MLVAWNAGADQFMFPRKPLAHGQVTRDESISRVAGTMWSFMLHVLCDYRIDYHFFECFL